MRIQATLIAAAVVLGGCNEEPAADSNVPAAAPAVENATPLNASGSWALQASGEGVALVLSMGGAAAVRLFCPAQAKRLIVNVPAFRPIGSEERMSFGTGGDAEALVADPRGDAQRGGVTGSGGVPANLAALIAGPVSVSYGAQSSGPHGAPPPNLAAEFVAGCAGQPREPEPPKPTPSSACLTQDGKPVPANRLRAVGTEPFWGARIEGRCVTYSHPEDQKGTRVWTRFSGTSENGTWTGALGGKPFMLRTTPEAGCSDGMSDNRYPIAVNLTVGGEQRSGCAAPL
jgi:uncharacterized membrane protein